MLSPARDPAASSADAHLDVASLRPEQHPIVDPELPAALRVDPIKTIKEFIAEWTPRLEAILAEWQASLPPEAAAEWRQAAAYIRHSSPRSLVGEAPDTQIRRVLEELGRRRCYVRVENLFFDVVSATSIAPRAAFKRLYERAMSGGISVIGIYMSHRMFRNLADALRVQQEFQDHGIELIHPGMMEGDPNNPIIWQSNALQALFDDMHARNTSWQVGNHFETISRQGKPVGKLPEVYISIRPTNTFLGRRGSVERWDLHETLAPILKEGCARYLAGSSFAEVARWSLSTELAGLTPRGHVMNSRWWYHTLLNPKLAGHQMPTKYKGFKTKPSARPKLKTDSVLVPCLLPALWDLDTYYEIRRLAHQRWSGPKERRSYRPCLLSGVAYDSACGHRMQVTRILDTGHFTMRCGVLDSDGPHSAGHRVDLADAELNELLGGMSFDQPELIRQVEEEVIKLAADEQSQRQRFVPDPEIASISLALANLAGSKERLRAPLEAELAELRRADDARREAEVEPVLDYRRALKQLRKWDEVWASTDTALKNQLLRDVGFHAVLGQLPGTGVRRPYHLLEVTADSPVFMLALSTLLKSGNAGLGREQASYQPYPAIRVALSGDFGPGIESLLGSGPSGLELARASVRHGHRPPDLGDGPWLTIADAAFRLGISRANLGWWLREGRIKKTIGGSDHGRRWRLLDEAEVDDLASRRVRGEQSTMSRAEAARFMAWLRAQLTVLPISRWALARKAGVSDYAIKTIEVGQHRPRLGTALKLARALAALRPASMAADWVSEVEALVAARTADVAFEPDGTEAVAA